MLRVWTSTSSKVTRAEEDEYIKANPAGIQRFPGIPELETLDPHEFDVASILAAPPSVLVNVEKDVLTELGKLAKISRETRDSTFLYVELRFKNGMCALTAKNDRKMMTVNIPTTGPATSAESYIMLHTADVEHLVGFLTKSFDTTKLRIMGDIYGNSIAYLVITAHGTEISNGVLSDTGPKDMDSKPKNCMIRVGRATDNEYFGEVETPQYEQHYTAVIKKTSKWALKAKPEYLALESRAGVLNVKFLGEEAQPIVANLGSPIMLDKKQISGDATLNSINGRFLAEFLNDAQEEITLHFGHRDELPVILEDGRSKLALLPAYSQQLTGQETFLKKVKGKVVTDSTPDQPKVSERRSPSVTHATTSNNDGNPRGTSNDTPPNGGGQTDTPVASGPTSGAAIRPATARTANDSAADVGTDGRLGRAEPPHVRESKPVETPVHAESPDGSGLVVAVRSLQSALESIAGYTDELLERITKASKVLEPKKKRMRGGEIQSEFLRALRQFKGNTAKTAVIREHCSIPSTTQLALVARFAKLGIIEKRGRGVVFVPEDFETRLTAAGWTAEAPAPLGPPDPPEQGMLETVQI